MDLDAGSASKMARRVVAGVGLLRIGVGVLLTVQPQLAGRGTDAFRTMTRTVGIRDIALGFGYVDVARRGGNEDITRWLWAGIGSDVADVAIAIGAAPAAEANTTAFAAAVPIPVILTAIALLRHLRRSPVPQLVPAQSGTLDG
jgi:hypothetical protein